MKLSIDQILQLCAAIRFYHREWTDLPLPDPHQQENQACWEPLIAALKQVEGDPVTVAAVVSKISEVVNWGQLGGSGLNSDRILKYLRLDSGDARPFNARVVLMVAPTEIFIKQEDAVVGFVEAQSLVPDQVDLKPLRRAVSSHPFTAEGLRNAIEEVRLTFPSAFRDRLDAVLIRLADYFDSEVLEVDPRSNSILPPVAKRRFQASQLNPRKKGKKYLKKRSHIYFTRKNVDQFINIFKWAYEHIQEEVVSLLPEVTDPCWEAVKIRLIQLNNPTKGAICQLMKGLAGRVPWLDAIRVGKALQQLNLTENPHALVCSKRDGGKSFVASLTTRLRKEKQPEGSTSGEKKPKVPKPKQERQPTSSVSTEEADFEVAADGEETETSRLNKKRGITKTKLRLRKKREKELVKLEEKEIAKQATKPFDELLVSGQSRFLAERILFAIRVGYREETGIDFSEGDYKTLTRELSDMVLCGSEFTIDIIQQRFNSHQALLPPALQGKRDRIKMYLGYQPDVPDTTEISLEFLAQKGGNQASFLMERANLFISAITNAASQSEDPKIRKAVSCAKPGQWQGLIEEMTGYGFHFTRAGFRQLLKSQSGFWGFFSSDRIGQAPLTKAQMRKVLGWETGHTLDEPVDFDEQVQARKELEQELRSKSITLQSIKLKGVGSIDLENLRRALIALANQSSGFPSETVSPSDQENAQLLSQVSDVIPFDDQFGFLAPLFQDQTLPMVPVSSEKKVSAYRFVLSEKSPSADHSGPGTSQVAVEPPSPSMIARVTLFVSPVKVDDRNYQSNDCLVEGPCGSWSTNPKTAGHQKIGAIVEAMKVMKVAGYRKVNVATEDLKQTILIAPGAPDQNQVSATVVAYIAAVAVGLTPVNGQHRPLRLSKILDRLLLNERGKKFLQGLCEICRHAIPSSGVADRIKQLEAEICQDPSKLAVMSPMGP